MMVKERRCKGELVWYLVKEKEGLVESPMILEKLHGKVKGDGK